MERQKMTLTLTLAQMSLLFFGGIAPVSSVRGGQLCGGHAGSSLDDITTKGHIAIFCKRMGEKFGQPMYICAELGGASLIPKPSTWLLGEHVTGQPLIGF